MVFNISDLFSDFFVNQPDLDSIAPGDDSRFEAKYPDLGNPSDFFDLELSLASRDVEVDSDNPLLQLLSPETDIIRTKTSLFSPCRGASAYSGKITANSPPADIQPAFAPDPFTVIPFPGIDLSTVQEGAGTGSTSAGEDPGPAYTHSFVSGQPSVNDAFEYNIQINFLGSNWTSNLKEDFENSANFLSEIIIADVADVDDFFGDFVDDIVIDATLADIDGESGTLGQAGPTYIRSNSSLPVEAVMTFDIADAANFDAQGLFDEIVLHEMIHSIGFGTLWDQMGLVDTLTNNNGTTPSSDDLVDFRFNGETAISFYENEFPEIFQMSAGLGIFVETDGGPGTSRSHWDETLFTSGTSSELMTGFINPGFDNFVSDTTIASLADLGYTTILG
jgi:hypothetical protein